MTTLISQPNHSASSRRRRWAWLGAAALLALGGAGLLALAGSRQPPAPSLADRWGVDDLRVVRSGAGHLLDFRYRVVDAKKAAPLLARTSKPIVIVEKTGARLAVPSTPKAGSLRSRPPGPPEPGRIYFALFSNRGGLVQRGDHVSVVIGGFKAPRLVVE